MSTLFILLWLALPIVVWLLTLLVGKRIYPVFIAILCVLSMLGGTYLLANYVWAEDARLLAEIDKYEDGTPEARRAAEEWASDTDRSFLLLLSPGVTAFFYTVAFLFLFGHRWLFRHLFSSASQ